MTANAPSRATGSLTIGFGLVNVPVQVFKGTEEKEVKRNSFSVEGNPVGYRMYDKETGEIVQYGDVVKKYEIDGEFVPLTDDEIATAVGASNGVAEVLSFVPLTKLGEYQQSDVLQVRPERGSRNKKPSPVAEKAFSLLTGAMKAEKVFALVRFTLRGKPRIGALTPDGNLHVLFYSDEVREALPLPDVKLSKDELQMARQLVQAHGSKEAPEVTNEAKVAVDAYAATKLTGEIVPEKAQKASPGDVMEALKASLELSEAKSA